MSTQEFVCILQIIYSHEENEISIVVLYILFACSTTRLIIMKKKTERIRVGVDEIIFAFFLYSYIGDSRFDNHNTRDKIYIYKIRT